MSKKRLYVFDLDDTLIRSENLIKIIHKKTGKIDYISTSDWGDFINKDLYFHDFSDFKNYEKLKKSKIIYENYKLIKNKISKGLNVCLMTSRGENDIVKKYLKFIDIKIPDHLVFTVGKPTKDYTGDPANRKRQAFEELILLGYNEFYFYDDSLDNINEVKKLEKIYEIKMNTIHIKTN